MKAGNPATKTNRIALTLVAVILMFGVIWGTLVYWNYREPLRAKTTTASMIDLMGVLGSDEPAKVDPESIRLLLARENRLAWLKDAWGRPFVIERKEENGQPHYTIISLGRDGRRGHADRHRLPPGLILRRRGTNGNAVDEMTAAWMNRERAVVR